MMSVLIEVISRLDVLHILHRDVLQCVATVVTPEVWCVQYVTAFCVF